MDKGGTAISGRLPTNTSGGFLSFSHAGLCGIFTLIEVVEQLRHEAGERQVKDATWASSAASAAPSRLTAAAILGRA